MNHEIKIVPTFHNTRNLRTWKRKMGAWKRKLLKMHFKVQVVENDTVIISI